MSRTLTTEISAEIVKPVLTPVWFIEADFPGGSVRVCTAASTVDWDGKSWTALGYLLAPSPARDTQNIEATGLSITLSGVPSELIATVYGEFAQGRPCTVWLGLLNASGEVIPNPVRINRGRLDAITDEDDGATATITVTVENGLRDLQRPNVRRYTHEEQQRLFPGDLGLQFVPKIQEREIFWGRSGGNGL